MIKIQISQTSLSFLCKLKFLFNILILAVITYNCKIDNFEKIVWKMDEFFCLDV